MRHETEYPTNHDTIPVDQTPHQEDGPAIKLSAFMKVSIIILVAVTLASISLLFIGDFDGKFERVFSTLALFTIFVLLTAFDTRRERAAHWYAPIALVANAYILGLLLIVIWVTPYEAFSLQARIMWTSVYVIVTTRVVVWAVGALLRVGERRPSSVARWGQVTSVFAILSLILFTAPLGIDSFGVFVPDMYWRIAVATLILTGLGLAVTLLLGWYYRPPKLQSGAPAAEPMMAPEAYAQQYPQAYPQQAYPQQAYPEQPYAQQTYPQQSYPQDGGYQQGGYPQEQPVSAPVPPPVTVAEAHVATPASTEAPSEPERLPWPTFADGSPYPMGADGQPDFAAAEQLMAPQPTAAMPTPMPEPTAEEQLVQPAKMDGDVTDSVTPAEPAVAASEVLAEDLGIQAENVVADAESASGPSYERGNGEQAILLPEISDGDTRQNDNDPLDEETSKREI